MDEFRGRFELNRFLSMHFWEIQEPFAMSRMVRSVRILLVLGINIGGIDAVVVRQN